MKEGVAEEGSGSKAGGGTVRPAPSTPLPKMVPRVDYQRIFVVDEQVRLLGEYALDDECPLEFTDLRDSIPAGGMHNLVAFYQGEYAFTPFHVEGLWFVVVTRGVPRIEERGSIGTLLAAMRVHLPASVARSLATREAEAWKREQKAAAHESMLNHRERRVTQLESDIKAVAGKLREIESNVRVRETRLNELRDYALQMQRSIVQSSKAKVGPAKPGPEPNEGEPPSDVMVPR